MLSPDQLAQFRRDGHLTVVPFIDAETIQNVLQDLDVWSAEFLESLNDDDRRWYVESSGGNAVLRKLDNPVYHRAAFRELALNQNVVQLVKQIIGEGVSVLFSQVFCKPPEVGGPKPVHQDNFYFGPDDPNALLTVWVALDDATLENGCLYYGRGSHMSPVVEHVAPANAPFNLQIPQEHLNRFTMEAAPVPAGGISIHHGNTWHQSSANTSPAARRALAVHYVRRDTKLTHPALPYDSSVFVRVP